MSAHAGTSPGGTGELNQRILCVDFGSTFTKAALVDGVSGTLIATDSHPTSIGTDLMEALDVLRDRLSLLTGAAPTWEVRACSSAGGGLRIAVVGNEELVTAEAGARVATSSGGRVVHIASGVLDAAATSRLAATSPDVVLLVGGTDGGNTRVLRANAAALTRAKVSLPVVLAGNAACQDEVAGMFAAAGTACAVADNVLPEIGVVRPEPARAAIRETFCRHVIGGKDLSRREEFGRIVRGPTPDLVLRGVEVLARSHAPDGVVVVDVGGATTDVHSVVEPDPEDAGLGRQVVADLPVSRTVEGDLGLRWNALGIVEAAVKADLLHVDEVELLSAAAARRVAEPAYVAPSSGEHGPYEVGVDELAVDERLYALAVKLALRRHAGSSRVLTTPAGRVVEHSGKDLRAVRLLVASGGLVRHGGPDLAARMLTSGLDGHAPGGWMIPERPDLAVDLSYVLAAVGLLADDRPEAAAALAGTLVGDER